MNKIRKYLKKIISDGDCEHIFLYYTENRVRCKKCNVCKRNYRYNEYYKRWKQTF